VVSEAVKTADDGEEIRMTTELEIGLYIFMLAGFLGTI